MRITLLAAGLIALAAPTLAAQGQDCLDSETVESCWTRLDSLMAEGTTNPNADKPAEALVKRTAGLTSLGSGFASTINDFLPSFAGALGLTQTTTEDGATSLETNLRLPIGTNPQRVRLQAVLRKPTLYQPLADTLPAATRDARVAALQKELGDFDDVRLVVAWNLENRTFGRSFEEARDLTSHMFREQIDLTMKTPAYQEARRQADSVIRTLTFEPRDYDAATARVPSCRVESIEAAGKTPIGCFTPVKRAEIGITVSQAVRLLRESEAPLASRLTDAGFYQLGTLVNNQPQLNLEFAADLRTQVVGPKEYTVTARYEGGFANLNGFRAHARARCGARADTSISTACLSGYLAQPGVRSSIDRGDRFFVSAAWAGRADYAATLAADGITMRRTGTWDLTGSAGYGRYVTFSKTGEETGRLDVTAEVVHHQNDPDRQNRFVAAATYSYRLGTGLVVAAGASYASKPEFLGDVDKKFGANFGLRYRFVKSAPGGADQ